MSATSVRRRIMLPFLAALTLGFAEEVNTTSPSPHTVPFAQHAVARSPAVIAGNWKLNPSSAEEAIALVSGVATAHLELRATAQGPVPKVIIFPPYPFIHLAIEHGARAGIIVGAQDVSAETTGAYTGEVSAQMVRSLGAEYALVGHSDRRLLHGEVDETVNRKVRAALAAGLHVILCVGEDASQFAAGLQADVTSRQLARGLRGVAAGQLKNVSVAYEPRWAIGTGKAATPQQAQRAHASIRAALTATYGESESARVIIMYGGSVTPDTASVLLTMADVDGVLVGGASLDAGKFAGIAAYGEVPHTKATAPSPVQECSHVAPAGSAAALPAPEKELPESSGSAWDLMSSG
mmetsp:Transcript_14084/g.41429  ORF Transcript_14084/g.41429 Transcript_14084/m.41429 type:complete len:351 (-) Transcript_14084:420-1472(-)